jgi:Sec-independent protein translocase protein TatA
MDSIFGIGLPEFVLIVVIAGMVMGPERIVRTARWLGGVTARLQTISRSFVRQLNAELDSVDETGQLKSTVEELDLLRRQVAELRNEVFTLATGAAANSKQLTRELGQEARNTILPPSLASHSREQVTGTPDSKGGAYRPPSLNMDGMNGSDSDTVLAAQPESKRPPLMPKRVEINEDSD